jgi:dihydroorotate dehydrogenase
VIALLRLLHRLLFRKHQIEVGGVTLPHPFILAAGMVKGHGFETEKEALAAVNDGTNIIPGWRSVPALVGLVEFGSFTFHPRLGNPGVVMWRDRKTKSTQNRVGLTNPGAKAAAQFLGRNREQLPQQFGINIAVSPGVDDLDQQKTEVVGSIVAFIEQDIRPTWFTLNLSCPNTEDDPGGNQTAEQARQLCGAAVDYLRSNNLDIPLWVKISPALADEQYNILLQTFAATGVSAVIATNTIAQPTPDNPNVMAGVAGGRLYAETLKTVTTLNRLNNEHGYNIDIIACGGVMDKKTYASFRDNGAKAVQYWSALVYRGPLAAAIIDG